MKRIDLKRYLGIALLLSLTLGNLLEVLRADDSSVRDQATATQIMVPMRDGVKLATDVYFPAGEGPWPLILARTPYNKRAGSATLEPATGRKYTDRGFIYAVQDQRGRFESEGDYTPHENEMNDGYDTVEWLAEQAWSTGRIGMTGASALGIAANLAAAADPPHLVCAYVVVAPQSLFYEGRFIGGIFKEADTGGWMRSQGVDEEAITAYQRRVVVDDRWLATDLVFQRHTIDIPIFNVGGWYDLFVHGNISNYQYLQQWGREGARGNQKLLMGPFGHGQVRGDIEYVGTQGLRRDGNDELRWFDYWLKGEDNGIMDEPPVRYYMMAAARKGDFSKKNEWRTVETWPPNDATRERLYFTDKMKLSTTAPTTAMSKTSYPFDPADPVKTFGGQNLRLPLGPMDQRAVGERTDYLRFETDRLTEDVSIAGKIDVELFAATDGLDTDFMVKLVDVYPDGYEALVIDTALRTRYRNGRRTSDVSMMIPGTPEKLTIDLWHSAITFEKGHRIAVHVTSSNYPRFEVNPNTGTAPGEVTRSRVAMNTIYHDAEHPSALILPVFRAQ